MKTTFSKALQAPGSVRSTRFRLRIGVSSASAGLRFRQNQIGRNTTAAENQVAKFVADRIVAEILNTRNTVATKNQIAQKELLAKQAGQNAASSQLDPTNAEAPAALGATGALANVIERKLRKSKSKDRGMAEEGMELDGEREEEAEANKLKADV